MMPGIAQHSFTVATAGRGLVEITDRVRRIVADSGVATGLAQVYTHHTSCSLLIMENADPTVLADMERFFARLVKDGDPLFRHDDEGPDDMPAHVRSALTGFSLGVPITNGALALGTWQGLFLWEHRQRPHQRHLTVTVVG
jgi:secondary thiamine-phosphate synthase enzyme